MPRILFTFLAIITLQVAALAQFKDPNAEVREAKDFHAISAGSAFTVYITQANEEAVAVSSSDKKIMEKIVVEVRSGVLHIGLAKGFRIHTGNKKLRAWVSFKNIDALNASGASNIIIEGSLKADALKLHISGASDVKGKLQVNTLNANISGAADATISGTVQKMDIDASGASTFKGFELATEFCDLHASGASRIRVTVNKELKARASGASDIDYKGQGVIKDVSTSGASSISKVGS